MSDILSNFILNAKNYSDCDFLCLRELIFAIGKDWFFLLGINFCDFLEVAFKKN